MFKIIEYVDVIEIALKLLTEYDTNEYYTSKDFSFLFSKKAELEKPCIKTYFMRKVDWNMAAKKQNPL